MFQIFLSCSQLHLQRKTVKHTVKLFSLSDPLTPSKLKFGHCISSKINQRISKVYTVSDQEAFAVCCNLLCCVWQLAIHRVFTIYNTALHTVPKVINNFHTKKSSWENQIGVEIFCSYYFLSSLEMFHAFSTPVKNSVSGVEIFCLWCGNVLSLVWKCFAPNTPSELAAFGSRGLLLDHQGSVMKKLFRLH